MLACDLVIAADDVQIGTPEVNIGLENYTRILSDENFQNAVMHNLGIIALQPRCWRKATRPRHPATRPMAPVHQRDERLMLVMRPASTRNGPLSPAPESPVEATP